jgi:putative methylase
LAVILSYVSEHPNPNYRLEQYSMTPGIAAEILWLAKGDVRGKVVYDLGCGTGRFAIGAALLGAREVWGVDIDPDALAAAAENAKLIQTKSGRPISQICRWVRQDVRDVRATCDTVVQFPPFGNDRPFFAKALEIARRVYSVHKATPPTQQALERIAADRGARITQYRRFRYYLPWQERGVLGYSIFLVIAKR